MKCIFYSTVGNSLQATGLRICCWEKVGRVRGVRDAYSRQKKSWSKGRWTSIQTYLIHSSGSSPEPKPKSMKLYEELPNRQPMSQCCFLIKESETGTWKSSCQWSHIPEGFYENTKYFWCLDTVPPYRRPMCIPL